MSTATPLSRAAARRAAKPSSRPSTRPPLSVVPRPSLRSPRLPFVIVVVGVLAVGLLGLLLLNTLAAQDAFRLHDLQRQATRLVDQEQALRITVERDAAPGTLAARAAALGMVPTANPTFIRLKDGRVLGVAVAAPPPPPPPAPAAKSATKPGAKAAAKPAAKPGAKPAAKPTKPPAKPPAHR
jgi:hypothetical protein